MSVTAISGWEVIVKRLDGRDINKELLLNNVKPKAEKKKKKEQDFFKQTYLDDPIEGDSTWNGVLPKNIHTFLNKTMNGNLFTTTDLTIAIQLAEESSSLAKGKDTETFFELVKKKYSATPDKFEGFPNKLFVFFDDHHSNEYRVECFSNILGILNYQTRKGTTYALKGTPYWSKSFGVLLYEITTPEEAKKFEGGGKVVHPPFEEVKIISEFSMLSEKQQKDWEAFLEKIKKHPLGGANEAAEAA